MDLTFYIERISAYFFDWFPTIFKIYFILFTIIFLKMLIDKRKNIHLEKQN